MRIELIAWDFDGVLNRSVEDGAFLWSEHFERDIGAPLDSYVSHVFAPTRFPDILRGRIDLADVLAEWIAAEGVGRTPAELMDYWFSKDANPDAELSALMDRARPRQVIATNNEPHRARYIEHQMGFGAKVDRVFAAGTIGAKKPEDAFFAAIEDWAEAAPGAILLIDDHAPNVAAAQARGWQGFHFTDATRADLPSFLEARSAL